MKKIVLISLTLLLLLTACNSGKSTLPEPELDFEKSITFGGFTINGDEQWDGEKTDTPLTNAIEELLSKKYQS